MQENNMFPDNNDKDAMKMTRLLACCEDLLRVDASLGNCVVISLNFVCNLTMYSVLCTVLTDKYFSSRGYC